MKKNVSNKKPSCREINEKVWKIIYELGKQYKSRCAICCRKCITGKGFTIHHIWYICLECDKKFKEAKFLIKHRDNTGHKTEKMYSDFKDSSGKNDRLSYYTYMEPIILKDKKRFAFLDNTHHSAITHALRFKQDNLSRYMSLIKQSSQI